MFAFFTDIACKAFAQIPTPDPEIQKPKAKPNPNPVLKQEEQLSPLQQKLPKRWRWLADEPGPKMLVEALKHYGLREIVGPRHNPIILDWANELAGWIGAMYREKGDEVPWCGLFVGILAKRSGKVTPKNPLSALAWADWGRQVAFLGRSGKVIGQPMLGDVMVFTRKGGGHVGLYVGEDAKAYHILGGNQGNAVSITRIVKTRFHSAHRLYNTQPANVRPIYVDANGPISENEQ